jgi:hypothetical protein
MKYIFFTLFSIYYSFVVAQIKQINIPINEKKNTNYWFEWKKELQKKIGLNDITQPPQKAHFRLWTYEQMIEVWQDSTNKLYGKITCWVEENVPSDEESTNRYFTISQYLSAEQSQQMWEWIKASQINTIPSEEFIKDWGGGHDGITYMLENIENEIYTFKSYWTPKAQKSLSEAIIVQNFIDKAFEICKAREHWKFFSIQIPFESYYTNGGGWATVSRGSWQERRKYKQERDKYRKSQIKDKK